jgi:hypothetical protein
MSQQIQITGGAKVRNLEGVLTGTAGVVNALGINVPSGIPQLDGSGKILVSQLPNSIMEYKGTWNAATNTPTLADGTGNQGDVYLCNVAGTANFGSGPIAFFVGDQVIYSGAIWQRASGATGTVTSVAVTESGDALTITGSPITTSGTINIGFAGTSGQYINGAGDLTTFPSLTGYVPYTGATDDVDLGLFGLTSNAIKAIGDNSTYGGVISIKQNNVIGGLIGTGYTELFGKTNILGISFGAGSIAYLSNSVLTAERTYTLPDITGTLALLEGNQEFSGYKTFTGGAQFTGTAGTYTDYGIAFTKGSTPTPFSSGTTNLYSDVTTNNIVIRDTSSNAKLVFNNSTQTYTFPALSGTMALLEGTQTFSGSKTFSATTLLNTIYIDGVSYLKHQTTTSYIAGYTTYSAKANGVIEYFFPSSFKSVLDFNDAADYTYTFPAADGTLALTSDLGGYVPYTGATANVNLGTFDLTADVITGATGSFASSGGSDTFAINHTSGSGIALNITKNGNGEGLYINKASGSGNAATIIGNLSGTSATFSSTLGVTGALSGTSATFSGDLSIIKSTAYATITTDATTGVNFVFKQGGVIKHEIFTNTTQFAIYNSTTSAVALGIANATGAATFSSSVTATSALFNTTTRYSNEIVGIQITNSGSVSAVPAALRVSNNGSGYIPKIILTDNNIVDAYITMKGGGTSATNYLSFGLGSNYNILNVLENGNVGIGTSSPKSVTNGLSLTIGDGATQTQPYLALARTASGGYWAGIRWYDNNTIKSYIQEDSDFNLRFGTSDTERIRITSGGGVCIGSTTDSGYKLKVQGATFSEYISIENNSAPTVLLQCWNKSNTGDNKFLEFYTEGGGGSLRGSIDYNRAAGLVRYNVTSDYRLKTDFQDFNGSDLLSNIKVYDYQLKETGLRVYGVVAHELAEVLPYAVSGEKDQVDENGNAKMQSVDYSKIVPILVKSIQELEARIKQLENK